MSWGACGRAVNSGAGSVESSVEKTRAVLFVHAGRDQILRMNPPEESDLVTVRRYPDEAHTWVVPLALPGILDWLFEHTKAE